MASISSSLYVGKTSSRGECPSSRTRVELVSFTQLEIPIKLKRISLSSAHDISILNHVSPTPPCCLNSISISSTINTTTFFLINRSNFSRGSSLAICKPMATFFNIVLIIPPPLELFDCVAAIFTEHIRGFSYPLILAHFVISSAQDATAVVCGFGGERYQSKTKRGKRSIRTEYTKFNEKV